MSPKKKENRSGRSGSKKADSQRTGTSARQLDGPPPTDFDLKPSVVSAPEFSPTSPASASSPSITRLSAPPDFSHQSATVSQPTQRGSHFRPSAGRTSPIHQTPPARTSGGRRHPPTAAHTDNPQGPPAQPEMTEHQLQLLEDLKNVLRHITALADDMEDLERRTRDPAGRLVATPLAEHILWLQKCFKMTGKNVRINFNQPAPPGFIGLHYPKDIFLNLPPSEPSSKLPEPSSLPQPSVPALEVLQMRSSPPPSDSSEGPSSSGRSNPIRAEPRRVMPRGPMEEETACQLLAAINLAICELSVVHVRLIEVAEEMRDMTVKSWLAWLSMNAKGVMIMCMKAEQLVLGGFRGDAGDEGVLTVD